MSVASAVRWWQRLRVTGNAGARRLGGRRPRCLAGERDWLLARLAAEPDVTLPRLVAEPGERGVVTSYRSVWRMVREADVTFKKEDAVRDREGTARGRPKARAWRRYQGRVGPERLVFVDETWAATNMTPIRGWSPRGQKLIGRAPHGRWRTMTFIAALRCDRIEALYVLDGPINGSTFTAWVEQCLLPTPFERSLSISLRSSSGSQ